MRIRRTRKELDGIITIQKETPRRMSLAREQEFPFHLSFDNLLYYYTLTFNFYPAVEKKFLKEY